jgi:hypothetical protein
MREKIIEVLEKHLLDGFRRYNWHPLCGEKEVEEIADEVMRVLGVTR